MVWNSISSLDSLTELVEKSFEKLIVLFKHSSRCSISITAKHRLDSAIQYYSNIEFYLINVLEERPLSSLISEKFNVIHQSPQVILLAKGECVMNESHLAIDIEDILNIQRNYF